MGELWEETLCTGCGIVFGMGGHVRSADNEDGFERCPGDGGSRRRVRIDLDAGAAALEGESMPWNASLFRRHAVARLVVDAALVTDETDTP